jgi:hypothetical protein
MSEAKSDRSTLASPQGGQHHIYGLAAGDLLSANQMAASAYWHADHTCRTNEGHVQG